MRGMIKLVCLPLLLFFIFILAGTAGLLAESYNNDLAISTTTFLGVIGGGISLVMRFYHSFY